MQRYNLVDALPRSSNAMALGRRITLWDVRRRSRCRAAASSSLTRRRDLDALQRDLLIAVRPVNPVHTNGYDFVNLTGARLCLPGLGASWKETPMPNLEEAIRERAYHLWIADGQPEGQADNHWLNAQREILTTSVESSGSNAATAATADTSSVATKFAKKAKIARSGKSKTRVA
jgi:hypothetical protein